MNKSGPILRPRLYKIAHNARSSRRARDEVMSKEPSVWDQHTFWRKLVLPKKGTREPTSGSVRLQGLRTGQRKTPPWASVVVPAPFAKPVSSGAAGATLGSKRRGRSRSNLSDYALDNRPSTGVWGKVGDRLLPQRVKRPLVPATGRQKKAPTEPGLLEGRGSRRC